ncbi:hypothetical protein [Pseudolysinimonas kribbensis]|uniref:hypothetical protein n=1 Tax=Pseudolysinimonas kribbensis TaxID=433641 RepID=UPI0024E07348|nr:hypothetical protein [Pseudolysinimonas kribbensis]
MHEFAAEIAHFAHSIRTGSRPLHTHVEGTEVLGIILAAYASARERVVAPVEHLGAAAVAR